MWFPLLGVFIGLFIAGSKEFKKVQVYEKWAANFDRSKYDIYAVMGLKNHQITWGKPTSKGVVDETSFDLNKIETIQLNIDDKTVYGEEVPTSGKKINIVFKSNDINDDSIEIPFTEIGIATDWTRFLNKQLSAQDLTL